MASGRYAEGTEVSVDKSRGEIERTLTRYGAEAFAYGWDANRALIEFAAQDRRIRFVLPLADRADREITHKRVNQHAGGMVQRSPAEQERAWEQANRQRWRALALAIKAKLESVESGITTFEEEFLAHVVLPDGKTMGQWAGPQIARAYETASMPPMLAIGASRGE